MAGATVVRKRSNLRWAVLLAVCIVLSFVAAGWATDHVGGAVQRVAYGVMALCILLSLPALVWVAGEAHLRWSPRSGPARALVGWTIAAGCIAVGVLTGPFAFILFLLCASYALQG